MSDLIDYFSDSADAEDFDLTLAQNSNKTAYYKVSYIDDLGASETVSTTGDYSVVYAGSTITVKLMAGDDHADMATQIASGIHNLASNASFTASALKGNSGNISWIRVQPVISSVATDVTPAPYTSLPSAISQSLTTAAAGAVLAGSGTNTNTSSYTITFGSAKLRYGWSIVAQNNGTIANTANLSLAASTTMGTMAENNGATATVSKLAVADFYNSGDYDDDADTASTALAYVQTFAQAIANSNYVAGKTTDRTGWL
jgi:hypothetical protein